MKFIASIGLLTSILLIVVLPASAQSNLSWELRAGADFPTEQIGGAELNSGYGFDGIVAYWFMPYTSLFGGWSWHQFSTDDTFAGNNVDFNETGYSLGLEFTYPLGTSPHAFYIRGGGVYSHLEAESTDGGFSVDSDHGLGWQAEAGVAFLLGNRWVIKPGFRYRTLSEDFQVGTATTDFDLSYYNLSIGITRNF